MRFFPQGEDDLREMLRTIGVGSVEALFESIPPGLRLGAPLSLPPAASERELRRELGALPRDGVRIAVTKRA